MFITTNEQWMPLKLGAVRIITRRRVSKKIELSIKNKKPLNIKLGADPSKPDLHIGHAVVLHKLRQFQDFGHNAILIIGDFTGMIGDPTGKSKTRPQLTQEETKINGMSYLEQATIILDKQRLSVKWNTEWLSKLKFADVIHLSAKYCIKLLNAR